MEKSNLSLASFPVIQSFLFWLQRSLSRDFLTLFKHVMSELVAVGKHDIVACIPDIIPSLHRCANLISVTMELQHADRHTWAFV